MCFLQYPTRWNYPDENCRLYKIEIRTVLADSNARCIEAPKERIKKTWKIKLNNNRAVVKFFSVSLVFCREIHLMKLYIRATDKAKKSVFFFQIIPKWLFCLFNKQNFVWTVRLSHPWQLRVFITCLVVVYTHRN